MKRLMTELINRNSVSRGFESRRSRGVRGFTLVETMFVVALLGFMLGGAFTIFAAGQSSWSSTETNIQVQENLRKTIERVIMELRQSETAQSQVFDGAGFSNTDAIRFSIPVICENGMSVIDANGDVAYWQAPLVWGCSDSSCMDADNDCGTIDYKSVEYRINNSNQLVRRVLDNNSALVREDVFTNNITDFQVAINGNVVNLQVTAQKDSPLNRTITAQVNMNVTLRN